MDNQQAIRQITQSDPVFKMISASVDKHVQLAMDLLLEKALAHQDQPKEHPLPEDAKAPEAALAKVLDGCGLLRRRKIRKALEDRIGGNRAAHFGALASVDPAKATPVLDQVRPLLAASLVKPEPREVDAFLKKFEAAFPRMPVAVANPPITLVLDLTKITCEQKTREAFEGKDEIELNVFPIREHDFQVGAVRQPPLNFKLGKFKEGDAKNESLQLASFPLDPAALRQGFSATLVLSEVDTKHGLLIADLSDGVAAVAGFVAFLLVHLAPAAPLAPWLFGLGLIMEGAIFLYPLWLRRLSDDLFEDRNEFVFLNSLADPLPAPIHEVVHVAATELDITGAATTPPRRGRYSMDLEWKFL